MNTKEHHSFAKKDGNETNPIILSESFYEYRPNSTINNNADQLVLWKLEKYNYNEKFNDIFNIDVNEINENVTPEEKHSNNEQCICMKAWKQLKHVFELTDEELMNIHSIKHLVPEDKFHTMPIDLNNDDYGENLKDFHLEGEYLYINNFNDDLLMKTNKFINEKGEPIDDEPNESPIVQYPQTPISENNKKLNLQNSYKNILNNSERSQSPSKNLQSKKKNILDNSKKTINSKCKDIKSTVQDNNKKEKDNNIKYDYTYGESYRGGIQCGHTNCVERRISIPSNKGWITDEYINNVSTKRT